MNASCLKWTANQPLLLEEFKELFRGFLKKYPRSVQELKRVGVACSGGPDSLALTLLLAKTFGPERVLALTVNHNMPGFGEEPVDRIASLLEPFKIPHKIIHLDWTDQDPAGTKLTKLQELTRAKRYEAFFSVCQQEGLPLLLTGHHLDDDIITLFYRFSRMSGVDGLASMKPYTILPLLQNDGRVPILVGRPLLPIPKSRLLDTCRHMGVNWIQDPENLELSFLRNSVRDALIQLQDSMPEDLHTNRLASLLHRLKEYRQEAQNQVSRMVNEAVLLDSSCIPTKQYRITPSSGDVLLLGRMDSSWWFRNVYLTTRLFSTLVQYVSNNAHMSGYYTIFHYCRQFCTSLQVRKRKDARMARSQGESVLPSMAFDNHYSRTGMNIDLSNPTRRLPFITTFNIGGANIYPLGGRDTTQRLELLSQKSHMTGPGVLICRSSPKYSQVTQYRINLVMQPNVKYLWDNRILIHYSIGPSAKSSGGAIVHLPPIESYENVTRSKQGQSDPASTILPSIGTKSFSDPSTTSQPYLIPIHTNYLFSKRISATPIQTPPPNLESEELNIRICYMTIEALKHMATLAQVSGQKTLLEQLEQFKFTCPSTFLHHYPVLIHLDSGSMILPTIGVALYLPGMREDIYWTSSTAGQAHFYNKLVAPSYIE